MSHLPSPKRIFAIAVLIGVPTVYLDSVTGGEFDALRMTDWDLVISGAVSGILGTAPPLATGVTAAAFAAVAGFAMLTHAVLRTVYRTAVSLVEHRPAVSGGRGIIIKPRSTGPGTTTPTTPKPQLRTTARTGQRPTSKVPASMTNRRPPNPLRDARGTIPARAPHPQSRQPAADRDQAVIATGQQTVRGLIDKAREVGGILLQILRYRDSDIDEVDGAQQIGRTGPAPSAVSGGGAPEGDPQLRVTVAERQGATAKPADRLRLWYGSYIALEDFNMMSPEILRDAEALRASLDDAALGSIMRSMDAAEARRMIAALEQALGLDAGAIAGHPDHPKATPLSSPRETELVDDGLVDWRDAKSAATTDVPTNTQTLDTPAASDSHQPLETVDISFGPRPIDEDYPDNLPPNPAMPASAPLDQPTEAVHEPQSAPAGDADTHAPERAPTPAPRVQAIPPRPELVGEVYEPETDPGKTTESADGRSTEEAEKTDIDGTRYSPLSALSELADEADNARFASGEQDVPGAPAIRVIDPHAMAREEVARTNAEIQARVNRERFEKAVGNTDNPAGRLTPEEAREFDNHIAAQKAGIQQIADEFRDDARRPGETAEDLVIQALERPGGETLDAIDPLTEFADGTDDEADLIDPDLIKQQLADAEAAPGSETASDMPSTSSPSDENDAGPADEEPEEQQQPDEHAPREADIASSRPGPDPNEILDLAASTAIPQWFSGMVKQALIPLAFEAKRCGVAHYGTDVPIPHMPGHGMALLLGAQTLDEIDHESVAVVVIFAAAPAGQWALRIEPGAAGSNDRFYLENELGNRIGLGDKRIQSIAEIIEMRGGSVQFVLHLVTEYGCVIDQEPSDDGQHRVLKTALTPFAEITVARAGELAKGLFDRLLNRKPETSA